MMYEHVTGRKQYLGYVVPCNGSVCACLHGVNWCANTGQLVIRHFELCYQSVEFPNNINLKSNIQCI